ncbi:MAG: energy-coupling factor ABC transporter ATP-binding protein [Deltaproteobacteria bacterium]|nr:energy-coupling factor ABC transporter ATP-binding protein [Deltaproteobacteria bacterium]
MKNIYQIQNLQHHYNGHPALDIDSFSIQPGTITGIIGPNGSGKSTLLKMLAFIDKPRKGNILFKGESAEPFAENVRFQTTLLSQEPYLMKRSVFKNISYGLELRRDTHDLPNRVNDALSLVGLPGNDFFHRKWYELSGGEAQRVALASRLILKPEVLLLDEPTASIDAASAQIIKDTVLLAQNKWGTTLVIASHDWEWLYDICEHVAHLFRGRFFGTGRQNFIFGPWWEPAPGKWVKKLQDGQSLEVPCPPSKDAIAIINPENMLLSTDKKACTIQGTVTRLVLEKHTREIIIIVQAANQAITARLSPKNAHRYTLHPGQKIRLSYLLEDVTWY